MVTENTLEVLNNDASKEKPKVRFWQTKSFIFFVGACYCFLLVFGMLYGYYAGSMHTSSDCNAWKEPIVYAMNEKDLNYLTDKNTFVQGINALYQINNEEHQVLWQGIQDLNKQLAEMRK